MSDTSLEIGKRYKELILQKSEDERFLMALKMIDDGYFLVRSRIQEEFPSLSEKEFQIHLIKRLYGNEFSTEYLLKIIK